MKLSYFIITIIAAVAFVTGVFLNATFSISGIENSTIALSIIDIIFLVLAVVSTTIGIVAIVFSWIFYTNSQKLNQESKTVLANITHKISKIDEIITQQYDKVLAKAIGAEYEGTVPMSEIQLLRKNPTYKNKRRKKK